MITSIPLPRNLVDRLNFLGLERLREYQFAVQIDGLFPGSKELLGFDSVVPLRDISDVREIKEGGFPGIHKFPKISSSIPITLSRGFTSGRSLWTWRKQVTHWTKGEPNYTRTMAIFVLDLSNIAVVPVRYEVWRFDIFDAWPSEWRGPKLDSMSNRTAIESVTIQHSGLVEGSSIFSDQAGNIISVFQL